MKLTCKPKGGEFIDIACVTNIAMVAGNETKVHKIVHEGTVKEWTAIGWLDIRPATAEDCRNFPIVNEED